MHECVRDWERGKPGVKIQLEEIPVYLVWPAESHRASIRLATRAGCRHEVQC